MGSPKSVHEHPSLLVTLVRHEPPPPGHPPVQVNVPTRSVPVQYCCVATVVPVATIDS